MIHLKLGILCLKCILVVKGLPKESGIRQGGCIFVSKVADLVGKR